MSKHLAIVIAVVISASAGVLAGRVLWREPHTPQQIRIEQQKCEQLPTPAQHETPAAAPPLEVWALSRLVSEFRRAIAITNMNERETKISAIVEHVDPAHLPELVAAIAAETPSQAGNSILMRLIGKWTDSDPEAALKFTSALPSSPVRNAMIMSCFMRLVDDDPASAESYIVGLPTKGPLYASLTSALIERMVQDDPAKALEFVAKLPPGIQADENAHVYTVWAVSDPERACAAALGLPTGNARTQALNGVVSVWVSHDPSAALDFAAKHDDKQLFVAAMEQAASSADHPSLFTTYLGKLPAGSKRDDVLATFASQWASTDLARAKAWAMALPDRGERDNAIAGLVRGRSYVGGTDSTDLLAEIHNPQMRARATLAVCDTIAQNDPNAGLRCVEEHGTTAQRDTMVTQVFDRWADTDPRAAADALEQMTDPPQQALKTIGRSWVAIDPEAALQWADKLPEGIERMSVIAEMTGAWAQNDPQAAAEFADRENNAQAIADTARAWAQADPESAMDWLQNRRSEVGRDDAIDAVFGTWSSTDEQRARAWAKDLPSGDLKNRSLQQLARSMADQTPEYAARTIMSMSGHARTEALAELYSTWNATDADGAAAWLTQAPLSNRERAAITTPALRRLPIQFGRETHHGAPWPHQVP